MRRRSYAYYTVITASMAALCGACDSGKPAGHAAPAPTASAPVRPPDMNTVAAILDKQSGGAPSTSLPPGHPPMGGAQPAPKATDGLPAGHPPMTGGSTIAAPAAGTTTLKYDVPSGWKEGKPTSSMRKAQFTMPRAEGDPEDGQLIVFYFGPGQGGSIEMNISRWKGMFTDSDGKPVGDDKVKQGSSQVDGMKMTTLDVAGRYADQMGRPDKPGATDTDFRMLAAIVEAPDGPWFFKAVGPTKTMAAQEANFNAFIKSIRK